MIKYITFEIEVTGTVTPEQIKEYIEMQLGCGGCSPDNPLLNDDSGCDISCYDVEII
jgi:hypothetical protein